MTTKDDELSNLMNGLTSHCEDEAYTDLLNLIKRCESYGAGNVDSIARDTQKKNEFYLKNLILDVNEYEGRSEDQIKFIQELKGHMDNCINSWERYQFNPYKQVELALKFFIAIRDGINKGLIVGRK